MPSNKPNEIDVSLTPDEALVLFEFLSGYSDTGELRIEDQAEHRALWNLCCQLEKELIESFDPGYEKLLQSARDRIRDQPGHNSNSAIAQNGGPARQSGNSGSLDEPPTIG